MKEKIDEKSQEKVNGGFIYDKGLFNSNPNKRFQVFDYNGNMVYECSSKKKAKDFASDRSWCINKNEITLEERDNLIIHAHDRNKENKYYIK